MVAWRDGARPERLVHSVHLERNVHSPISTDAVVPREPLSVSKVKDELVDPRQEEGLQFGNGSSSSTGRWTHDQVDRDQLERAQCPQRGSETEPPHVVVDNDQVAAEASKGEPNCACGSI